MMFRLSLLCSIWLLSTSVSLAQNVSRQGNWWQRTPVVRTKYYSLKTDLPRDQAIELSRHMDATCESYYQTFSKLPVRIERPAALGLFLFASQADYISTLSRYFRTDGTGSAGLCIRRGDTISLVGFRGDQSPETMKPLLQHEGFHQFASLLFPDIPKWANEGFAEVYERGVAVGGTLMLGEIRPRDVQLLTAAIENGKAMSVGDLMRIESREWNQHVVSGKAHLQYLQAWSLVQYFLFAEGGRHRTKFLGFLVQLNSRADWEKAFVSTFGWVDLRQLQKRWLDYCSNMQATDVKQNVREMQYLAAGMMHLRSQQIFPSNMTELAQALADADFEFTSKLYGKHVSLDPTVRLLRADNQDAGVQLVFRDSRGRKPSAKYAKQKSPRPLNVRTTGLAPQDLAITWKRRGKEYSYRIEAAN